MNREDIADLEALEDAGYLDDSESIELDIVERGEGV
jgi:hypothetical protein